MRKEFHDKQQADLTTQKKIKKYIIEQVPRKYAEDNDATTKVSEHAWKLRPESLRVVQRKQESLECEQQQPISETVAYDALKFLF